MINAGNHARRLRMPLNRAYDYFASFERQAAFCEEMAKNLKSGVNAGEFGSKTFANALHTMRGDVTEVLREIQRHLVEDLVVPYDRDDLRGISHAFEELARALEAIASDAYVFCRNTVPDAGVSMLSLLVYATNELKVAALELKAFPKNPDQVVNRLTKIRSYIAECRETFMEASHGLYRDGTLNPEDRRVSHAMLADMNAAMGTLGGVVNHVEALWQ